MKNTVSIAAVFAVWTGAAHAQNLNYDAIIADFQKKDYTHIEITTGPTQVKVEALRAGRELEVIYDRATGDILEMESELADEEDLDDAGVVFKVSDEDFTDDDDHEDDDDDDDDHDDHDDHDDDDDDDDHDDDDDDDDDDDHDDDDDDDEEDDD